MFLGNSATTDYTVLKINSNIRVGILTTPVINAANKSNYTITGDCSPNNGTLTVRVGTVSPSNTPSCPSGTWEATFDLSDNTVTADTDAPTIDITVDYTESGASAPQATGSTWKDTVSPTISFDEAVVTNILYATKDTYPLAGGCSEPGQTIALTLSDGNTNATTSTTCDSGNSWQKNVISTFLEAGTNNITITATLTDRREIPRRQHSPSPRVRMSYSPPSRSPPLAIL